MIVKMKKVTVFIYNQLKEQNLKALKSAGILHLEKLKGKGEHYFQLIDDLKSVRNAISTIDSYQGELKINPIKGNTESGVELAKHINRLNGQINEQKDKIAQLRRKCSDIEFWGKFSPKDIHFIQEKGLDFDLYLLPAKKEKKLPKSLKYFKVAKSKDKLGIAVIRKDDSLNLPDFVSMVDLPSKGIPEMEIEIDKYLEKLKIKESEFTALFRDHGVLLALESELESQLEFEEVNSATILEEENELSVVSGFIPSTSVEELIDCCKNEGMGYLIDEVPQDNDDVPVLIKNNPIVKLIKPVFNLLGTIPGYNEFDISPFFLMFFILFFSMIFGDAGYGAILFSGGVIGVLVSLVKRKKPPVAVSLLLVLSVATIIWGTITGSWFGSKTLVEESFLKQLVIPKMYAFDPLSQNFIIYFCFIIAMTHLTIAHFWSFLRMLFEKPVIKAFAQLGWLLLLYGLFFIVLNLLLSKNIPQVAYYFIGIGLPVIVIFGEQDGAFFKGIVKGFSNIVITFLSAISMFSDIISYIRLFAVGLASLEIAKAFNLMAQSVSESVSSRAVGIFAAVVILFIGHSLNLVLGGLSVVVHGVRLNMLEFSGHLGMEWAGDLYDPFREKRIVKQK